MPPRERPFAAFAVAVQVVIVNEAEELLLLSSPTRNQVGEWQVVSGGPVVPGDDMAGSQYRWWSLAELETADIAFHPSTNLWRLRRAAQLHRLWRDNPPPLFLLQPPLP